MDREKVIKGIECHRKKIQTCNAASCLECPYAEPKLIKDWCMSGLMDDIYAMLKEQEPVEPIDIGYEINVPYPYRCGKCKSHIRTGQKYCDMCGQAVKWE